MAYLDKLKPSIQRMKRTLYKKKSKNMFGSDILTLIILLTDVTTVTATILCSLFLSPVERSPKHEIEEVTAFVMKVQRCLVNCRYIPVLFDILKEAPSLLAGSQ